MEVSVCIGSSCHLKGSYNVILTFQQLIEEHGLHDRIDLRSAFCMKRCQHAGVGLTVDDKPYHILPEDAQAFFVGSILPKLD